LPASSIRPASVRDVRERQYREFWPAVRGLLRRRYAGLSDHEELYQEAWTELLEYEASGQEVRDVRALLKTIAERRARDRLRNHRPVVVDPGSATFTQTPDAAASTEEQVQVRLDAAAIRQVIDTLDEREAAALKLRYDLMLEGPEISRRLGISQKRLEKVGNAGGRPALLGDLGRASGRAARCGRRPAVPGGGGGGADPPTPRIAGRRRRSSASGGRRAARQVAESVAPSGAAEPVTAGAVALGAGGAAKVALACLAAGGTAAVCLTIATPSTTRPEIAKPVPRAERPTRVVVRETRPPSLSVPAAASKPEPRTTAPRKRRSRPETETPVSSKQSQPAVSPAPAGSTEFGLGALGSAQASVRGSTCHPGRRRC
jgi:RNA polymerase sigma factor (sigma-70 family)